MKIFDIANKDGSIMKARDMSIEGRLFGIRIVKGKAGVISSSGYIAELYIEDDENFHLKCSLDADWLTDLEDTAGEAYEGMKEQQLKPFPNYGHVMTLQEFVDDVMYGYLIDYDGMGYYAMDNGMTDISVSPSDIKNGSINRTYTHVIWFNR